MHAEQQQPYACNRSSMHWKKSTRAHCGTQNCSVPCFYAPPIGNLTLCCTMLLKFRAKARPVGFQPRNWGRKLNATVDCTYPCRFRILCIIKNTHQPCLLSTNASYVQLTGKIPAIAPDCSTAQRLFKSKVTCQLCHLKFTKVQEWNHWPSDDFFLSGTSKGCCTQTCNSYVWRGLCTA
jgi:hypothetical protein